MSDGAANQAKTQAYPSIEKESKEINAEFTAKSEGSRGTAAGLRAVVGGIRKFGVDSNRLLIDFIRNLVSTEYRMINAWIVVPPNCFCSSVSFVFWSLCRLLLFRRTHPRQQEIVVRKKRRLLCSKRSKQLLQVSLRRRTPLIRVCGTPVCVRASCIFLKHIR